ncbi:hypothetical protein X946_5301 [Burkholderia sp. ABCPW 111]|nr:hypothetical protein X946_5301 [Burkholderia sp. ABCPW 111]
MRDVAERSRVPAQFALAGLCDNALAAYVRHLATRTSTHRAAGRTSRSRLILEFLFVLDRFQIGTYYMLETMSARDGRL